MKHFLLIASTLISLTGAAQADYITVTGETSSRPLAHSQYCVRDPKFCSPMEPERVELTEALYDELEGVDDEVNKTIIPMSDQNNFGRKEYWSLPRDGLGDCEDYALLKRQMLLKKGWPAGAMRLVMVKTWDDTGHMVLAVSTDKGDLILDNNAWEIRDWGHIPYTGYKVQNLEDPTLWMIVEN